MWKPAQKGVKQVISGASWAMTKTKPTATKTAPGASSNWAALKKTLPPPSPKSLPKATAANGVITKNAKVVKIPPPTAKLDKGKAKAPPPSASAGSTGTGRVKSMLSGVGRFLGRDSTAAGPSSAPATRRSPSPTSDSLGAKLLPLPEESALLVELREMIMGRGALTAASKVIGNYVAIDCEMVGLGPGGSESALARVSLVNFHGHILLDTFVMPRETVTDWRSWVSGVRAKDLVGAPGFEEVQKKVAGIVEGRIVVGHAIQHDLRILLLSHPGPLVRDTQKYQGLREKAKSKHPGLKKLAALELGVEIQGGAHSSVTDARATMALYRLHKTAWEASIRGQTEAYRLKMGVGRGEVAGGVPKRKRSESDAGVGEAHAPKEQGKQEGKEEGKKAAPPGGGKKGVSAGIGVVIHRKNGDVKGGTPKRAKVAPLLVANGATGTGGKWWEQSA